LIGAAASGRCFSSSLVWIGFRANLKRFAFQRAYFLPGKKTRDPRSKATSLYSGCLLSSRCASRGPWVPNGSAQAREGKASSPSSARSRIHCQLIVPRCHRKTTARVDCTGTYGLAPFRKNRKICWQRWNGTSGKMVWQRSVSKRIHSRSKDDRLLWRSGNHYSPKHTASFLVRTKRDDRAESIASCSARSLPFSPDGFLRTRFSLLVSDSPTPGHLRGNHQIASRAKVGLAFSDLGLAMDPDSQRLPGLNRLEFINHQ